MTSTLTPCPDPEALAAWLDQGLSSVERERVTRHLAGCSDCRRLATHILQTQDAIHETTAAAGPVQNDRSGEGGEAVSAAATPQSRRIFWGAASALTVAAMLLVLVQLRPWEVRSIDSKLADLVAAVGEERTVEARLSGGFRYGPLRSPVRSGGSSAAAANWTLYAAAGRIREDAEQSPNPANLHALGLALLLLGDHDGSVRALEDAVVEAPDNARYQTDLSAAYLARARQLDRPDDYPRALEAAERALKIDGGRPEARFNRALALESLFLVEQARRAWEEYLARDGTSGWADEARRHLQALPTQQSDAATGGSRPRITANTVEAGLDWLLRRGLPAWADAILSSDLPRADAERAQLIEYAGEISARANDPFARALVQSATDPALPTITRRAQVAKGFADGLLLVDQDDLPGAEKSFAIACAATEGFYEHLCALESGMLDVIRRRSAEADNRILQAEALSQGAGSSYLIGRAERLAGYRLMFAGNEAGAAKQYEQAYRSFSKSSHFHQAGAVAVQLADLDDLIGLPVDAWRWRRIALQAASGQVSPAGKYVIYVSTAESLRRGGHYVAAVTVLNTVHTEAASLPSLKRAIVEILRTRLSLSTGDYDSARVALADATRLVEGASDFRAQRLLPDILRLQSVLALHDADFDSAQRSISSAIELFGPERNPERLAALLSRASIVARRPESEALAEQDVNQALDLLRTRTAAVPLAALRPREAEATFDAIAAIVTTQSALQGIRGLHLVERLRELVDGTPADWRFDTAGALDAARSRLRPTEAAVTFLLGDQTLLSWTLTTQGIEFQLRPFDRERLERLTATLSVLANRSPGDDNLWRPVLAELYDLVFADLPAAVQAATDVVVVPDGHLNRVPFGALVDSRTNQYLFERSSIRLAPNLAIAFAPVSGPLTSLASVSILSIGAPALTGSGADTLPRLAYAGGEARAVAELYVNPITLVGEQASRHDVLKHLSSADVIHFAGHAISGSDDRDGRLLLAGNVQDAASSLSSGALIGRLPKHPRVVLAACEAGSSPIDRGMGIDSLAAGFLRAGATSVVANLWPIDDAVSKHFFVKVHESLSTNRSSAQAVARAQRSCRSDPQCRRSAPTWIGTTAYGSQ
jgi:CHAT domain-containing protein/tetratricopeptide (TPR) repeat protein